MGVLKHSDLASLRIVENNLLAVRVAQIRDKATNMADFRTAMKQISRILAAEVLADMPVCDRKVETPLQKTTGKAFPSSVPAIVTILRAGLGLSWGFEELLPEAPLGHVGVYRDETTHRPIEYLVRLPKGLDRHIYLTDPMLATGHSSVHAIDLLKKAGVAAGQITLVCTIAVPEGVKTVMDAHPDVVIYTSALDECLNENAYIVPGLGDAGDRYAGT